MKIGILTPALVIERNMEHLLFQVASLLAEEHQVELIGLEETSGRVQTAFTCYTRGSRKGSWRWLRRAVLLPRTINLLLKYKKDRQPDLIMTLSNIGVNGLSVAVVGRVTGLPHIIRTTSDIFEVYKNQGNYLSWRKWRVLINNNILGSISIKLANKVILLSESFLPSMIKKGFKKEKFLIIPQPIKFGGTKQMQYSADYLAQFREKHGLEHDDRVILYAGRLDPDKGIYKMAETINYILSKNEKFHFFIAGDGLLLNWLKENVPAEKVHFLGQIPREDLPLYYKVADAFFITSPSEGLSTSIAEAMYFKLPVIATDSGPVTREMVNYLGETPEELGELLLQPRLEITPFPEALMPKINKQLWLEAVTSAVPVSVKAGG